MWYHHDRVWNEAYLDRNPGIIKSDSPKPVSPMEAIPVSSIKIKTHCARDHVNIIWSTGHHHKFRWCSKWKGWWNANADTNLYVCHCRDRQNTCNQQKDSAKQ